MYNGRIARAAVFVLAMVIGVFHSSSVSAFSGSGAGTSGNPFQITTCAQLNSINLDLAAYYVLANDIDCAGGGWSPIGMSGGGFTGTLDGQNYKISHLDLSEIANTTNFAGMFSAIKSSAVVKNLRVIDGKLNAGNNSGMVTGGLYDTASLDNVYVQASVTCHGDNCGGLVGSQHGASIINNSGADVMVTNDDISTGGLVGWISDNGTIQESFADGYISGTLYVGGLIGAVNNGGGAAVLTNSYANVTVVGSEYLGGLAGLGATLNVTKSYAAGSVSGTDSIGGLVGLFYGHMAETFAATSITGTGGAVGPVTGHFAGGTVGNRYFDANITGFASSPDGSSPITNSDYFRNDNSNPPFDQWDFSTMWRTNYNDYPSFAPKIDPYMLCEEPHSTDTTITGSCTVAPLGWGTPSWQARWSLHGANDWHTVNLGDIHKASATVTGLTPGKEYDLSFRYTNDFGTGPWGTVVILTTGDTPTSNGKGATPSGLAQALSAVTARFYAVIANGNSVSADTVTPTTSKAQAQSSSEIQSNTQEPATTSDVALKDDSSPFNWFMFGFIAIVLCVIGMLTRYLLRRRQTR